MIDYLTHLFKYNNWATEKTANSILQTDTVLPEAIKLLSHYISAQYIWLSRITGEKSEIATWDNFTVEECMYRSTDLTSKWINLLEGSANNFLEKRISYQNTKGEKYENSIKDICSHVINHSTYHRAQIAKQIKSSGGTPAVTDYIVYQRELQK